MNQRVGWHGRVGVEKVDAAPGGGRLVFGWASVSVDDGVPVGDGEWEGIRGEVLEKAAYRHVANRGVQGVAHDPTVPKMGRLVESFVVTPDKTAAIGLEKGQLPDEAWWVGYEVPDAWVDRIEAGDLAGLSIEGTAVRVPADELTGVAKHARTPVMKARDTVVGTEPKWWLEDLDVDAVDLVWKGSNPGSRVVLWKAAAGGDDTARSSEVYDSGDHTATKDGTMPETETNVDNPADTGQTDDTVDTYTVDAPAAKTRTRTKAAKTADTDTDTGDAASIPTAVAKELDAIRAENDRVRDENAKLREAVDKAAADIAKAAERELDNEIRDIAGKLPYIDHDNKLAPVLKAAKATIDGELFLDLVSMLHQADTAIREGTLVEAAGHDLINDPDDRVMKAARDILDSDGTATRPAAVRKAYETNPDVLTESITRKFGL